MQCEHLPNPLGLDALRPRLAWRLHDPRRGARQTAYRLVVGTDSGGVRQGQGAVWAPAKVLSDRQLVPYGGPALRPFTKYFWRVQTWGARGTSAQASEVANPICGL